MRRPRIVSVVAVLCGAAAIAGSDGGRGFKPDGWATVHFDGGDCVGTVERVDGGCTFDLHAMFTLGEIDDYVSRPEFVKCGRELEVCGGHFRCECGKRKQSPDAGTRRSRGLFRDAGEMGDYDGNEFMMEK
jgi:hypothetical protein